MSNNYHNDRNSDHTHDNLRPDIYNDESPVDDADFPDTEELLTGYDKTHTDDKPRQHQPANNVKQAKNKRGNKSVFKKFFLVILAVILSVVLISWLVSLILPAKTPFLIMATDQDGTRTDTIMYGVFDKSTKKVSLLSIPRDTYITVNDDVYAKMNEEYPEPGSKSMKINAVHHFGGKKYGTDLIVNEVEKLTGTQIKFYVKVNFSTFRYIIDAVGGIDFYVPQAMEYHDPLQNLHISLQEGQQHLSGEQAEQVLRYRSGYANADLGRVNVQQQFMKAFIAQVFSKGAILSNPMAFVRLMTGNKYLDTNVGIFDALPYLFVLNGLDTNSMESYTLPGYASYAAGQSVYIYDPVQSSNIINEMMK